MKKTTIIVTAVILILAIGAAICLLPWPTKFDLTFHGAKVSADGTVLKEGNITIEATRNNYLFKNDTYDSIDLRVPGYQYDTDSYTTDISITGTLPVFPYEYVSFMDYESTINGPVIVRLALDIEHGWCFVSLDIDGYAEPHYFVGSVDEDFDPKEIMDICSGLLPE